MSDPAQSPRPLDRAAEASKVGNRLRAERERLGISLRELARGVAPAQPIAREVLRLAGVERPERIGTEL